MDYSVRFIGHVIETRKPQGWPATIENSVIFRADDKGQVFSYLNEVGKKIRIDQGIVANLDLPNQEKSDVGFGNGKFIPMHMLTHISFSVRLVSGEMPDETDQGVLRQ